MPETITPINIDDEMKSSYLDYAMSVIIGRALPDVRDGLKPVHRRVLFAMYETGNVSNKPYKKSARIVGDVMGKYHPHGDQAIYDTIVRMAQEFSLRHPLVDGQGNFGSIDGDSAAAMRYTEIRMEEITSELLRDLDKDTVQFTPNYDDSLKEPSVLPASFPQLLVNGSSGIAVGMATNIPPHNLTEIIDAAVHIVDNPDCTVEDLMALVPGPDFPTRGIIQGRSGIRAAYKTGRGIIRMRGRAEIEPMEKGDRERIIINELPFQVNKAKLVEKIAELVRDKRLEGISDLRDESDREGIRVVVELKKGIMGQVVLNSLYKNTQLQDTFGVILLALVNQQPKVLNLKEFLHHFVLFRKEVVTRRTEFDLNKAREKEHILEGLTTALDNLDAVVQLIRQATDPTTARDGLMAQFGLSEIQAKAILEMRLQRLTGLERKKIIEDLEETRKRIKELQNVLAHEEVKLSIIKEELIEIKNKYGNERRTEIAETDESDIDIEDLIADEDAVVVYTRSGYIKRQTVDNYRAQKRGGKGIRGMNLKEEDVVEKLFIASTLSHLLIFTSIGKIHWLRVFAIPDVSRIAKGKSIANLLRLQPGESIASILSVREFEEDKFVMVATERGIVKKTSLMAYSKPRQGGIIGLTTDKGDRVIGAELCDGESDILLATEKGFSIRFSEKEVRPIGRTGRGVRGIRLKKEDRVVGAEIVQPGNKFLTVTSKGYGKRTRMEEYPVQGRGGLGVMTIRCNEKIGTVVGVQQVEETDQLLVITSNGNIVRMRVNEISVIGRNTQGVRLVGIGEGNQVVSIEKLVE
ncbi:MAG: DNA gyrase subunit A [Nitrospina sp.]|jgi:DNA gyrase subunit A|nr:DNA gyrase subunit A [Nitrospina sp.]MBT3414435.1 DNA gyrase subunit A [Nitrospina sp.]MBT3857503.1 DNA gyrase subunit A [Nitrospina sp.]MBT4103954.1 DNA gyrase subunit A [Nitrospina sp.]MBT4388515.1 DNA gyrase subunit A [Nitrospina sp.]